MTDRRTDLHDAILARDKAIQEVDALWKKLGDSRLYCIKLATERDAAFARAQRLRAGLLFYSEKKHLQIRYSGAYIGPGRTEDNGDEGSVAKRTLAEDDAFLQVQTGVSLD